MSGETTTEKMIALGKKLDTTSSRFPYTYHHDVLRMKVFSPEMSRSEVAGRFRNCDGEELYAIGALMTGKRRYLASLVAQDILRVILALVILVTAVLTFLGY